MNEIGIKFNEYLKTLAENPKKSGSCYSEYATLELLGFLHYLSDLIGEATEKVEEFYNDEFSLAPKKRIIKNKGLSKIKEH